jgi:hypothetical protein
MRRELLERSRNARLVAELKPRRELLCLPSLGCVRETRLDHLAGRRSAVGPADPDRHLDLLWLTNPEQRVEL